MEKDNNKDRNVYKLKTLVPLYFPWLLACFLSYNPVCSYLVAWLGTFFIFCYSLRGPLNSLVPDRPISMQVMRPMILIQLVFSGLMSATSIFYFIDHLGFSLWSAIPSTGALIDDQTSQLAYCQRLYVFAHASLVFGMIVALQPKHHLTFRWTPLIKDHLIAMLLFTATAVYVLSFFPGLNQFSVLLAPVPKSLACFMILIGFRQRSPNLLLCGTCYFFFSLYQMVYSGYKEGLFVHMILLLSILFHYYRRLVISLAVPIFILLIYFLPIWTNTIRNESWHNELPIEQVAAQAYSQLVEEENQDLVKQNSWDFLTNRFSEIGMFRKYVAHVPEHRPYYQMEIFETALYALIPRIMWPAKPDTEAQSMERVYEAGVLSTFSNASAKTRIVVDGYLSAGYLGILITMIGYGFISQSLCNVAERLFGGYEAGCIIVFNGMFQQLWRGNNFEFILNNMAYGCLLMIISFYIIRHTGLLTRVINSNTYLQC